VRLTGLTSNTLYHFRIKAVNCSPTTIYSGDLTFTTKPSVTTTAISNITSTTASSGGIIEVGGSASITARGVCWSTNTNPTLANNYSSDGTGTGSYISNPTSLTPSTLYYLRAYATNSSGTSYGNQVSFTTSVVCTPFAVTHVAGSVAPVGKTVTYGTAETTLTGTNKCWITKNLGATSQATYASDNSESSAGWYWQFNHKQGFKHDGTTRTPATTWITYINENSDWTAANDPCSILLGNGFRLPTNSEWSAADTYWGNYYDTYGSVLKLHAAGWLNDSDGSLANRGSSGGYQSSTQGDNDSGRKMGFNATTSYCGITSKAYAFTVRCLKE